MTSARRVLVVEDNAAIRDSLRDLLEFEGYAVDTADDGRAGLAALDRGEPPTVVLLDLMMPVMDGWDVLAALQARAAADAPPVIVVSGATDAAEVARRYGCEVLVKPVDVERLLATLARLCATA